MSPRLHDQEPAPAGALEAWREAIEEALGMVAMHARLGQDYAATSVDAGLEFSIRSAAAHMRAAIDTFADLKADKARRAARHG